jgi:hypothetical protein
MFNHFESLFMMYTIACRCRITPHQCNTAYADGFVFKVEFTAAKISCIFYLWYRFEDVPHIPIKDFPDKKGRRPTQYSQLLALVWNIRVDKFMSRVGFQMFRPGACPNRARFLRGTQNEKNMFTDGHFTFSCFSLMTRGNILLGDEQNLDTFQI